MFVLKNFNKNIRQLLYKHKQLRYNNIQYGKQYNRFREV